ncbi:PLP-dependent transferase [Sparassis latifolia]
MDPHTADTVRQAVNIARSKAQVLYTTANDPSLNHLKNAVIAYLLLRYALKLERHLFARGPIQTVKDVLSWVSLQVILLVLRLPPGRNKVERELGQVKETIEKSLVPQGPGVVRHLALPATGQSPEWIIAEMTKMDEEAHHADWAAGKVSGAVYHGGQDINRVILSAIEHYSFSNPLHPDVFPAVRKMEAEIVSMCLNMYNNPNGAGATTSGGTESIIMAVKTYRDWARATKGITEPEIVVPISAHAAFDKGANYMGIKVHTIPVHPMTRKVQIHRVAWAINPNTIMIAGSAINFPDGCQDDIVALAKLAKKHKIGLHVDCCLGGFIMPFLEEAGFPVEPFDFRVDGVTSISCDTHKYGFAPKGNSVIMYRNAELRRHQYYVNPDWVGGVYASPSIAGSRPGSLIAGTWAALHYVGHSGYVQSCRDIVSTAKDIAYRITTEMPELYVLGSPPASVVAFSSTIPTLNILEVGDKMSKKGWHLNALSNPAALHIACTRPTVGHVDNLIDDLKDAIRQAKGSPSGKGTMVTLYGLGTSSAVGPAMVGRVATLFIDTLYKA